LSRSSATQDVAREVPHLESIFCVIGSGSVVGACAAIVAFAFLRMDIPTRVLLEGCHLRTPLNAAFGVPSSCRAVGDNLVLGLAALIQAISQYLARLWQ